MAIPGFSAQHSDYKSASTYASTFGPGFLWSVVSRGLDYQTGASLSHSSWIEMAQTSCDSAALTKCLKNAQKTYNACVALCPAGDAGAACRSDCETARKVARHRCQKQFGCPAGETCCGGQCCGPGKWDCVNDKCQCPPRLKICDDGACIDPYDDDDNCGGCNAKCSADRTCCHGTCSTLTENSNCGGCGIVCNPGPGCLGGECPAGIKCTYVWKCPPGLTPPALGCDWVCE